MKHTQIRLVAVALALLALSLALIGPASSGADRPTPSSAVAAPAPRPEALVVRLYFHNNAERDRLAAAWSAEEADTRGGYLTVWTDRAGYARMLAQGLHAEIDEASTQQANNPVLFGHTGPDTFDGGYRTVEEMQTFLDQEVAAHPTLAQKVDIGDSWCKVHAPCLLPASYNGYDLLVLHITNQQISGHKPVFWYDAGIHSREIATPEIAMRYISWLLDNYATNADAHWLVDWQDTWVMPMFNPDGHHIVEAGINSPYSQRKNANNTNGCTTWPPTSSTQFGTDNNRNFPFKWNCCGGSSGVACDQTYHGPSANSEPETQAVIAKVRTLIADQRGPNNGDAAPITATGVLQNMHSNASLDLYPWGWTGSVAPNGADLANISAHVSATNAAPAGNGYQSCQPPNCLYAVDGDSIDWAYGERGIAAISTEIEGSSFFPPYSQMDTIWQHNQGQLIYLAKIARAPYLTTRGPDVTAVATSPMTVTQGTTTHLTATINYAWTGNAYSQNVGIAQYSVDSPVWNSPTPIQMQAVDGSYNSPTEQVQATVPTSGLAPGRHILFVRGRGVTTYAGLKSWGPVSAVFLDVVP